MSSIRQATITDYGEIQRFLEHAYGHPHDFFPLHYPSIWRRETTDFHHIYLIRESGRLASLVRVFPLDLALGGARVRVGGIGAVATAPECLGKGYMSRLMEHAIAEMKLERFPLSVLWGDRHRYRTFGYEIGGRKVKFTVAKRGLEKSRIEPAMPVRYTDQADLRSQIQRAYERHAYRRVRTEDDFRWLGKNAHILIFCVGSGQHFGYLAVSHGDRAHPVVEFGGDPVTVLQIAGYVLDRFRDDALEISFPDWNSVPAVLRRAASDWRLESAVQIKILDIAKTVKCFAPQLESKGSLSAAALKKFSEPDQVEALFGTVSQGPFNVFVWPLDHV